MKKLFYLALLILAVGLVLTGCKKEPELGTEENPIIWSFVPSGEMQRVTTGAEQIAKLLHEKTGYYFRTNVATEYAGVIEALASDPPKAHISSLATFAYVMAAERGVVTAKLVAVRYGSPTYNGQIMAGADTGITTIAQLKGKSFGRPDPLSTSGWIIPMLTMKAAGIDTDSDLRVVDAGSHDAVVTAIYNGDVDAGASFVDARTNVEEEYPDVMEKVRVIATTADIPNDGVQFSTKMPEEMIDKIVKALLEISKTDEGKEALDIAYQWGELIEKDDSFYDPFRQVLQASGLSIEDLTN